jgi:hypothetical protein
MSLGDDRRSELNPYHECTIAEVLPVISQRQIDVSLCFYDPGLAESKRECETVNRYFHVAESHLIAEFRKSVLLSCPIFEEDKCRGKTILVWLSTHFDGDDFVIQEPLKTRWNPWDFFGYIALLGLCGYKDIFVFFNLCYSKVYSDQMWASFVDMQGGMTISAATKHFFVHKYLIPIADSSNAAQLAIEREIERFERAECGRNAVRAGLAKEDFKDDGRDVFINYVKIEPTFDLDDIANDPSRADLILTMRNNYASGYAWLGTD